MSIVWHQKCIGRYLDQLKEEEEEEEEEEEINKIKSNQITAELVNLGASFFHCKIATWEISWQPQRRPESTDTKGRPSGAQQFS